MKPRTYKICYIHMSIKTALHVYFPTPIAEAESSHLCLNFNGVVYLPSDNGLWSHKSLKPAGFGM